MEALRHYVVMLTAISMICGVLLAILGKGLAPELGKLVIGTVLIIAAVNPLTGLRFGSWNLWLSDLEEEGRSIAAEGAEKAMESQIQLIKTRTAEYIHDTAGALGAEIQAVVRVEPGNPPRIVQISLAGRASAYTRQRLEERIEKDLGIAKENLEWTGLSSENWEPKGSGNTVTPCWQSLPDFCC